MDNQKEAFLNYEADSWFDRNKCIIDGFNADNDLIIKKRMLQSDYYDLMNVTMLKKDVEAVYK